MTTNPQSKDEAPDADSSGGAKVPKAKSFEKVWSPELGALGFTQISDVFLHQFHRLAKTGKKMSDSEFVLLIHLMSHKRDDSMVWPSVELLAQRMGKTERQILRLTSRLKARGLLLKQARTGQSVRYDMRPLIKAVEELIPREKSARAKRALKHKERNLPDDLKTEKPAPKKPAPKSAKAA